MAQQAAGTAKPLLPLGVWHVHEIDADHFAVCGLPSRGVQDDFWRLYMRLRAAALD